MKIYKKRIAILISKQHFVPHGGIGSFCKSFFEMCDELEWRADIILDQKPTRSVLTEYFENLNVNFYYADPHIPTTKHSNIHMHSGDGMCWERVINFRDGFLAGLAHHTYDMVVINTPEGVPAIYNLAFQKYIPIVFYTHNENAVFFDVPKTKVFNESFDEFTRRIMSWEGIVTATQTDRNRNAILDNYPWANVHTLPMRVAEQALLQNDVALKDKEGAIFIGRFETRKNPDIFIDVMKKTGIKPKIMTNQRSLEKFQKAFKAAGITDYEIKYGIIGDEKADYIKSARIGFHPALQECNPFSAFETLHSCPTIAIEEHQWHVNFGDTILTTPKANIVSFVKEVYNNVTEDQIEQNSKIMNQWNQKTLALWKTFLEDWETNHPYSKGSTTAKLHKELALESGFTVNDLYFKKLKRIDVALADIFTVYNNRANINIFQTDIKTFISADKEFKPTDSENLFTY